MPSTLHLDTGREMRGGQWQVLYLLEGLAAAGEKCTLLARAASPLLSQARERGLDARPLHFSDLLRLARSYDLIHAHDARAHTLASFLSEPFVVSRRVAFPIAASLASKWKYSRPARYIAVSNQVKTMLAGAGIANDRIDVVYDGVPLPPEPAYNARSSVLALDSTDPLKGKLKIQDAARRAGIEVKFTNNLVADLATAAVFIYMTDSEGLGSAALVAMAAGVPVVASAVGGLPEIVDSGVTGLLISDNSSDKLADVMLEILPDRALLVRLGRNARARVEREFTTQQMLRNTLRVYEKVLG